MLRAFGNKVRIGRMLTIASYSSLITHVPGVLSHCVIRLAFMSEKRYSYVHQVKVGFWCPWGDHPEVIPSVKEGKQSSRKSSPNCDISSLHINNELRD